MISVGSMREIRIGLKHESKRYRSILSCFLFLCALLFLGCKADQSQPKPESKVALSAKSITPIVATKPALRKIVIQPYGDFSDELILQADSGITSMYKLEVLVLKAVPLPSMAFYAPRNRYKADSLLVDLYMRQVPGTFKIIGLTSKDISTTSDAYQDWGIFGLGSMSGQTCVVSSFRLKTGNASRGLLTERLIKVINHEIGHTLGLDHCINTNCLMEDAGGSIKKVDKEDGSLCAECRERVGAYLY